MDKIWGQSEAVKSMKSLISRVAPNKTNVLIIGESGTGKELVARAIHDSGPLKNKAFIPVNCGAIPENLIESELFGHTKGSFTGAIADKSGLFEAANGGTIFLDEVGELPLPMQVKLLRVIQERNFRKVGGTADVRVDVRIIAATNRDLEQLIKRGEFREDLYYRLNVILIRTPPLRERDGDVMLLAEHFLERFRQRFGRSELQFDDQVKEVFQKYSWPGNVRELENAVESAVALSEDCIVIETLPQGLQTFSQSRDSAAAHVQRSSTSAAEMGSSSQSTKGDLRVPAPDFSNGALNLDEILGSIEKKYILSALEHSQGVKKTAADLLGITFRSIRYRLKKLGVETSDK